MLATSFPDFRNAHRVDLLTLNSEATSLMVKNFCSKMLIVSAPEKFEFATVSIIALVLLGVQIARTLTNDD